MKKSPSRGFQEVVRAKKDSELEVILRRRRKQACDPDTEGKRINSTLQEHMKHLHLLCIYYLNRKCDILNQGAFEIDCRF